MYEGGLQGRADGQLGNTATVSIHKHPLMEAPIHGYL